MGAPSNPEPPAGSGPYWPAGSQPPQGQPPGYPPQGQPPDYPAQGHPPGSYPQPGGSQQQPNYPQQTLLPQQVQRSRSRRPLVIGLVVALVLAVGGIVAWQLLKNDGEQTRTAYCSALRRLTHNGDLTRAFSVADVATLGQLAQVQKLAPDAVRGSWATLQSLAASTQGGAIDASAAIKAVTSLRTIADDAKNNCGIPMNVPGLS